MPATTRMRSSLNLLQYKELINTNQLNCQHCISNVAQLKSNQEKVAKFKSELKRDLSLVTYLVKKKKSLVTYNLHNCGVEALHVYQ